MTPSSSTLIDHMYSNMDGSHVGSGVIKTTISDHFMIYSVVKHCTSKSKSRLIKSRNFKHFKPYKFLHDARTAVTNLRLYEIADPNLAWEHWRNFFSSLADKHAPFKSRRVRNTKPPWLNNNLLKLIKQRDQTHALSCSQKDPVLHRQYQSLRNQINWAIKQAKREYATHSITLANNNSKKIWDTIRFITKSGTKNNSTSDTLDAKQINNYFIQIGPKLAASFCNQEHQWHLPESVHVFNFQPISEKFILKELSKLPISHKIDVLDMDSYLLRPAAPIIAPSLTYLANILVRFGSLPYDLKIARVTPVFKKKGSADQAENYRPISVVSHVAKIFEKAVCNQLMEYLNLHSFITPMQSAFITKHSTQTALHKVTDDLLESIDENLVSALCFFDIGKCFDCIPHDGLLFKLSKYGITGVELKWFHSYLTNRMQYTIFKDEKSTATTLTSGIPQGSALGPCLFLLFVNDLVCAIKNSIINIYADDTHIYVNDENVITASRKLQEDINNVAQWFHKNKLSISIEKTFTMFVGSKQRLGRIGEMPKMYLQGQLLANKTSAKYLGLIIDQHLTSQISARDFIQKLDCSLA